MRTLRRKVDRIAGGNESLKIKFTIILDELSIPKDAEIPVGSQLSFCFERGGKTSSSQPFMFHLEQQSSGINPLSNSAKFMKKNIFELKDTLELIATLYKSKNSGVYGEKVGKLYLRRLTKKSLMGSDSYKGIGMHELKLHEYATNLGYQATMTAEENVNFQPLAGVSLKFRIVTEFVKKEEDDTMSISSIFSDTSEVSTIGAQFEGESPMKEFHHLGACDTDMNYDFAKVERMGRYNLSPEKQSTEVSRQRRDALLDTQKSEIAARDQQIVKLERSLSTQAQLYKAYVVSLTSALATSKQIEKQLKAERDFAVECLQKQGNVVPLGDPETRKNSDSFQDSSTAASITNVKAKSTDKNRTMPTVANGDEIRPVVAPKSDKSKSDEFNSQQMQAPIRSPPPTPLQISALTLSTTRTTPATHGTHAPHALPISDTHGLDFASDMLAAMFPTGAGEYRDQPVSLTLAAMVQVQKDNVSASDTNDFHRTLQALSEDLEAMRMATDEARQEVVGERSATREASTAVMQANMRRAEIQQEADRYLNELIEVKMKCADQAIRLDEEKKRLRSLKSRLQSYAEAIGSMEVRYCNISTGAALTEDNIRAMKSGSAIFKFAKEGNATNQPTNHGNGNDDDVPPQPPI